MSERCSLSSSCSTGVMPREAGVDTSPVRDTFLKFAAPNSWRLWTYDAQVSMPGDAANSTCGSQKVGISTDGRTPRNSLESQQRPSPEVTCPHEAPLTGRLCGHYISTSRPTSTTWAGGTPKYAAGRLALRCIMANRDFLQLAMPVASLLGITITRLK